MSWLFTRIDRLGRAAIAFAAFAVASDSGPVSAQTLETAVMPGKVISGHAKVESDCRKCHIRFDRSAQPRLCLDCHQEVAADVRAGRGFHGRLRERDCRQCHTDHRGREARIVLLDEKQFDHAATDFALLGRHAAARCASCHRPQAKHRASPSDCAACHRKDDAHKGRLGAACADCHDAANWKDTRFDHGKTRFALLQRHARTQCAACHADQRYAETPRECLSCHRKDDVHKGQFGARCASCHDASNWKSPTFQHDRDTYFALRDRHRAVKCDACHRGPLYESKTPANCHACHRKDDAHKGALGDKCEVCHTAMRWKASRFDHDRDSRFRLHGKHREAKCGSCHRERSVRDALPRACIGCHRQDDRERGHRGRYGEACEPCHAETGWKSTLFRHDRDTRYPLRGRHARVACDSCHRGALYREKASTDCIVCHERDDKHRGQLGRQCDRCHSERDWHETGFEHARSRFPLLGRHAVIACRQCHATPAFLDAKSGCADCHARDDVHRTRLGTRCEQCHDARSWKGAAFDHSLRTRFRLQGAHARVTCHACHTAPAEDKLTLASDCSSCHAKKDDVHFASLGLQCERCHVADDWRTIINRASGSALPERTRPADRRRSR